MLVIFALALTGLVGMVGLIIDGGDTALQRRDMQNVADAAAMAAGYALVNGMDVVGQQDLKDGDQIELAGVTLRFCVHAESKNNPR